MPLLSSSLRESYIEMCYHYGRCQIDGIPVQHPNSTQLIFDKISLKHRAGSPFTDIA